MNKKIDPAEPYFANIYVDDKGVTHNINDLISYAPCDKCGIDMTENNGCNSYWISDDKMITICNKCSKELDSNSHNP